jgi:DNA-binding response OmpR family regulator
MGRILIIDDEQTASLLRAQLSDLGHEVVVAPDAVTGLNAATHGTPGLVMLGWNMPGGGGQKLLERLRGNAGTASVPVIFLFGQSDRIAAVTNDPRVRLLQKPTDADTVKMLVEELLPTPAPAPVPPAAAPVEPVEAVPEAPAKPFTGESSDDDLPPGEILEL